jgi:hypothetical protein
MASFNRRSAQLTLAMILPILAACATDAFSSLPPDLIVEGDKRSYPAFEAAAKACAYTDYWRLPGAKVQNTSVSPHFNLYKVNTRAARCTLRWIEDHPDTGLRISSH